MSFDKNITSFYLDLSKESTHSLYFCKTPEECQKIKEYRDQRQKEQNQEVYPIILGLVFFILVPYLIVVFLKKRNISKK